MSLRGFCISLVFISFCGYEYNYLASSIKIVPSLTRQHISLLGVFWTNGIISGLTNFTFFKSSLKFFFEIHIQEHVGYFSFDCLVRPTFFWKRSHFHEERKSADDNSRADAQRPGSFSLLVKNKWERNFAILFIFSLLLKRKYFRWTILQIKYNFSRVEMRMEKINLSQNALIPSSEKPRIIETVEGISSL